MQLAPLDALSADRADASATPEAIEASHLRHLLDKQPSCLLRVGRDGLLLACNDAGLRLLGKEELVQVLERSLDEYFAPAHLAAWREFRERAWLTGARYIECTLVPAADAVARTVQIQAVALRNHPDGLESMLMAVRDTTTVQRLEESLHAEQGTGHEETVAHLQAELAHAGAAQKRLQALLGRAEAEQQRLDAEHATDRAESERARGELSVLKNQLLNSANQRIELQQWQETASTLERLADMGRLAMQFSCELHGVIATLDERSRLLLSLSRGEVTHHPITAAVHDAVRATSLAQQLSDTNVEPPLDPETP